MLPPIIVLEGRSVFQNLNILVHEILRFESMF